MHCLLYIGLPTAPTQTQSTRLALHGQMAGWLIQLNVFATTLFFFGLNLQLRLWFPRHQLIVTQTKFRWKLLTGFFFKKF